jgi:DNA polymerase sigma
MMAWQVSRRSIASHVPWSSQLPPPDAPIWETLGKQVVTEALKLDTGATVYQEVHTARRQLESILRSLGYDASLFTFGGVTVMGLFESGGDVDFVAVSDIEPDYSEASEMVSRLSREMRRIGLRTTAIPRARVPVLKADRVSRSLPGARLHELAKHVSLVFARPLSDAEETSFTQRVIKDFGAVSLDWKRQHSTHHHAEPIAAASESSASSTSAAALGVGSSDEVIVAFTSTEAAVAAMAHLKRHGTVEIPLRLPVDPRHGPELYRYHFDLTLSTMGLRNSRLLGASLSHYAYGRHLLLMLKRWGRSSGIVNTFDGLLASYALTVLCVHFLVQLDAIPPVDTERLDDPNQFPKEPPYRPLEALTSETDTAKLGYLFAAFFEYYGRIFEWDRVVVSTTEKVLTKSALQWEGGALSHATRPPYYHIAIKDPYGLENIGRNVSHSGSQYILQAYQLAFEQIQSAVLAATATTAPTAAEAEVTSETAATREGNGAPSLPLIDSLVARTVFEAPKPTFQPTIPYYGGSGGSTSPHSQKKEFSSSSSMTETNDHRADARSNAEQQQEDDARYLLKKMELGRRQRQVQRVGAGAVKQSIREKAAEGVTQSMVGWLRSDH